MTNGKHPQINEKDVINIVLSIPAETRSTEFKFNIRYTRFSSYRNFYLQTAVQIKNKS
jgi:hypothetical protein